MKEVKRRFNDWYEGEYLNQTAFPLGGIGAGMLCLDGTGSFSHLSLRHGPDVYRIPLMFASLTVPSDGGNACRVLEGPVAKRRIFGMAGTGNGGWSSAMGLPHFGSARFLPRFPFAAVELEEENFPAGVSITGWSPFIPLDSENSSLPVAGIEYEFENRTERDRTAMFAFNAENIMKTGSKGHAVLKRADGLLFRQEGGEHPWEEGYFSVATDDPDVVVDPAWFRGGWFDPMSILWRTLSAGRCVEHEEYRDGFGPSAGGSLFVPFTLAPGARKTIRVRLCWYVPVTNLRFGKDAEEGCCASTYKPWYAARFGGIDELADYWRDGYDRLRAESACFRDTLYRSTVPPEILEAVASNLTILKSPTVLRQEDGRLWCWEGCCDGTGCCAGSCTHVWNYAQAIPHLFPDLERSLRKTEFGESQSENGHQAFRSSLPIRPAIHDFHSAADGQLGGIMKMFREWRISGDTGWLESYWPKIRKSLDYCIETWDPDRKGILEEPHHNTYDIEFWGPDGMCGSFYLGALKAAALMGDAVGDDTAEYRELYGRGRKYLEAELYDGEYFIQEIRWKDLRAPDPSGPEALERGSYSPEAAELLRREGPKYQYGSGCLSDGVLGAWIAEMCGVGEILDPVKVESHLMAVYRNNLEHSLVNHANPQRPTFAVEDEGGLLLCTWPKGGELSLPFVYSNEVWTGIEYQVASHLMLNGRIQEGLDIVKTCRSRYDGRVRNPFNEYECGHWYARAMASYGLLQGFSGIRYDAVDRCLTIEARGRGDFEVFLSTASGFGTAGIKDGKPFVNAVRGEIPVSEYRLPDRT